MTAFPPEAPAGQGALTFDQEHSPAQQPTTAFHRGTSETAGASFPHSLRASESPGTGFPPPNHPSHEPLPNKSHQDAKQSRQESTGREIPHTRPGEAGTTSPSHPLLPNAQSAHRPPSPALPSTPGCFIPAHNLPDLLNKPPGSGKPTAFLAGKVVKGSNGCWKRQGGETRLRHKALICRNRKGCWGFGFSFPSGCNTKTKSR